MSPLAKVDNVFLSPFVQGWTEMERCIFATTQRNSNGLIIKVEALKSLCNRSHHYGAISADDATGQ
jgi:hypothetical protein